MNAETAIAFVEDILERSWGRKGVGVCTPYVDLWWWEGVGRYF